MKRGRKKATTPAEIEGLQVVVHSEGPGTRTLEYRGASKTDNQLIFIRLIAQSVAQVASSSLKTAPDSPATKRAVDADRFFQEALKLLDAGADARQVFLPAFMAGQCVQHLGDLDNILRGSSHRKAHELKARKRREKSKPTHSTYCDDVRKELKRNDKDVRWGQGVSMERVFSKVAKEHGVEPRTIRSAWKKFGKLD